MSGFSFGSGTAPAFGAQQSNAPAAPSGGLFGTSTAAPSAGFGFGGTSTAPAANTSAPSTSGFSFGGTTANPPQNTGGLFGSNPPAGGGLFGSTAPASTAPATGGLFSSNAPSATAQATGGGLFGSSIAAAPSTGGLFASAAPSTGTFSFSSQPQQQQQQQQPQQQQQQQQQVGGLFGGGLFGSSQAPSSAPGQPGAAQAPGQPGAAAPFPEDRLLKEVWNVKDTLDPAGPSYKFRSLLLNVVPPEQRMRPGHVGEGEWREALERAGGENNADHLWPVLASGFGDLNARRAVQEAVLAEDTARREKVAEILKLFRRNVEVNLQGRLDNARRRQGELLRMTVQLLRLLDALEGRLAMQMGMTGDRQALAMLQDRARSLEFLLDSPQGLQRKVDGLHAAMNRMHGRAGMSHGASGLSARGSTASDAAVLSDPASLQQLHEALRVQVDAAGKLQDVLLRAQRSMHILETESKTRRH